MKVDVNILLTLQSLAGEQRGVLTTRDLEMLFGTTNRQLLKNRLNPYLQAKILIRFCRGFYVVPASGTKEAILEALSQRICPQSVISVATVLAKNRMIGTYSKNTVYAVKAGTTRRYTNTDFGTIVHLGFNSLGKNQILKIGSTIKNGICYADPERALLDTLYFYQKGSKFFFNIYSDVDVKIIDRKKFLEYLKIYPNSRFQAFARNFINK